MKPLQTQGGGLHNPFHWLFWEKLRFYWHPAWLIAWNSVASNASLLVSLAFVMLALARKRFGEALGATPLVGFWSLVKGLRWAQFWYTLLVPGLIVGLRRHRRWALLLLTLHALQDGRAIVLLSGHPFGYLEGPAVVSRFRACTWRCDYQAP